ncbi:FkbM family methyltransferase [Candidatus Planktophila dulcis]|uniref:FkbM family methyltransferase n=1 Tax=Candidatus Planktophila dulcis TaxID=1884914 RepID=UPI003BEF2318
MTPKAWIKARIHPLVWERLGQAKQEYEWTRKKWQCESNLIPIFEKYLGFHNGFYVDVGSNDGRSHSNTYDLEFKLGWNGVLVEPIMHLFFRSRQIRNLESNSFFNCACVSPQFNSDHVELLYSGSMTVSKSQIQEYEPNAWAKTGSQFLSRGEIVQSSWSSARTLESILIDSKSPKVIDLLSIDVEGAEFGVLLGLDLISRKFRYILIETNLNSKAYEYLIRNEYLHIETIAQNLLFRHESELQ